MPRKTDKKQLRDRRSTALAESGAGRVPPGGKTQDSRGRVAVAPAVSSRWPLLVVLASAVGLLLGATVVALSLVSVATPRWAPVTDVRPDPTRPAAATNPGSVPAPVAAPLPVPSAAPAAPAPTRPPAAPAANPTALPAPAATASTPLSAQVEVRTKGNPSAPVVVTEWFDFQCPSCGRWSLGEEPIFEKQYVETGKARFVSRNFAFLGAESFLAAESAQLAADQGRYWAYHTLLFQRQRGENLGAFRAENLKQFAAELGLDQAAFNSGLDRGVYRDSVLAEAREARTAGVNATPTFFVNGKRVDGVPTAERLGKLVDEELAKR